MAAKVAIESKGLNSLTRKLGRMDDDTRKAARKAVGKGILAIQADAKRKAPVDTGRLRSEIHHELDKGRAVGGRVISSVDYALAQEFGTRNQSGTPYMRPAAAQNFGKITADLLRTLNAALARSASGP